MTKRRMESVHPFFTTDSLLKTFFYKSVFILLSFYPVALLWNIIGYCFKFPIYFRKF